MIFPASFFSFILSAFLKNRVALQCAAAACLLTVRMYYQNKLGALDQAFDALHRTGAKTVPVFAGYTCYGRVFEDWNGDVHFVDEIGKW